MWQVERATLPLGLSGRHSTAGGRAPGSREASHPLLWEAVLALLLTSYVTLA